MSKMNNSYESIDSASSSTNSAPSRSCDEVEGSSKSSPAPKITSGGDTVQDFVKGRLAVAGLTLWAGVATAAAVLLAFSPRGDTRGKTATTMQPTQGRPKLLG